MDQAKLDSLKIFDKQIEEIESQIKILNQKKVELYQFRREMSKQCDHKLPNGRSAIKGFDIGICGICYSDF